MKHLMKNVLALCLILALCLGLSACAAEVAPSLPTPAVPEESEPPVQESPAVPEPEVPSAGPASAGDPSVDAGCEVLENIYERYYPGTAGSSLSAARYAAMLLDWYVSIEAEDSPDRIAKVRKTGESFASGHDLSPDAETENGVPVDFPEKFRAIWSTAMSLAFGDTAVLEDAGYAPQFSWDAPDADMLFASLYEGLALDRLEHVKVYFPDDQVMYLLTAEVPVYSREASYILYALKTAHVVPRETELLSCETDAEGMLHLDLSGEFREYVCKMGTSGEALTMAGLVNTFLEATGTHSLRLTVEGKDLETGHAIYDFPLSFEDSFTG